MSAEFDGQVLAAIARLETKVDALAASAATQGAAIQAIRAEIGVYPSVVDLARASVSDLTPDELVARSDGTGICGAIHRLARNDATIVAEIKRSAPTVLAKQSDRKANVAAILGAAAAVISAMLGATR
jgi:hypothetical protein